MSKFIKLTSPGDRPHSYWVRRDSIIAVDVYDTSYRDDTIVRVGPLDLDSGFICAETPEAVVAALDNDTEVQS